MTPIVYVWLVTKGVWGGLKKVVRTGTVPSQLRRGFRREETKRLLSSWGGKKAVAEEKRRNKTKKSWEKRKRFKRQGEEDERKTIMIWIIWTEKEKNREGKERMNGLVYKEYKKEKEKEKEKENGKKDRINMFTGQVFVLFSTIYWYFFTIFVVK